MTKLFACFVRWKGMKFNMVHINIICIGKLKEKYLKEAQEEYIKRLSKYCDIEIIELNDEQLPSKINNSIIEQNVKK